MTEFWLAYRDVEGFERRKFELMEPPPAGAYVIKPGVIPGAFGYKDIYVAWHISTVGDDTMRLVTYTETPVNPRRERRLLQAALKFVRSHSKEEPHAPETTL